MGKSSSIMELVSGYKAYAQADELGVHAAADAPATSYPCIASVVSSGNCAVAASAFSAGVASATYEVDC